MACQCGHTDVVEELLNAGAYIGPQGKHGFTPLIQSSHRGYVKIVKLLLRQGSPHDTTNDQGFTALHLAAQANRVEVMELLLRAGADPTAEGPEGYTPMTFAVEGGHKEAKALLAKHAGSSKKPKIPKGATPLHVHVLSGNFRNVRNLLEAGVDPDARDGEGLTPLHEAILAVSPRGVAEMLRGGADVNAMFGGSWGAVTPLCFVYACLSAAVDPLCAGNLPAVRDALLRDGAFRGDWRWPALNAAQTVAATVPRDGKASSVPRPLRVGQLERHNLVLKAMSRCAGS